MRCLLSAAAVTCLSMSLTVWGAGDTPPLVPAAAAKLAAGEYAAAAELLAPVLATERAPARRAEALGVEARLELETGKYEAAEEHARDVLSLAPATPEARTLLAAVLVARGKWGAARQELDTVLEAEPLHVEARLLRIDLAELLGDRTAIDTEAEFGLALYRRGEAVTAPLLTLVARAVESCDPHGAWQAYNQAHKADPDYLEAYVRGGFHCYRKYAWHHADEEFAAALHRRPTTAAAQVGLAAAFMARGDYDAADKCLDAALAVNPKLVAARQLRAQLLAVEEDSAGSRAELEAALAVNPTHPRTLSLLAAHEDAAGADAARDRLIEQVTKLAPASDGIFTILAKAAERRYQFAAAAAWARRAIERDPQDWEGYHLAGMSLLRLGEEKEGYDLLDRAFKMNRFNIWAYNVLLVLDQEFKGDVFRRRETPHFVVKLDKEDDAVLWPYLEPALEAAYERLTAAYRCKPVGPRSCDGKILLLVLPTHQQFSARTVGLPGLAAAGVCFGQVILMPSPRVFGQQVETHPGWRAVLEHELVHVLNLQQTDYRIPRWLTEGLATMEEHNPGVQHDPLLVAAAATDRLLPLPAMNQAFVRPRFPGQMQVGYCHAALICQCIVRNHGRDAMLAALAQCREGVPAETALAGAAGTTVAELETELSKCLATHLSAIRLYPPIGAVKLAKLEAERGLDEPMPLNDEVAYMQACLEIGRYDGARAAAGRILERDSGHPRAQAALGVIAWEVDHDAAKAAACFGKVLERDGESYTAHLYLGRLAREAGDTKQAIRHYEAARRRFPRAALGEQQPYDALVALYEAAGERKQAVAVLEAQLEQVPTRRQAWLKLGELRQAQGRSAAAVAAFLRASEVDPYDVALHRAAAAACEAAGDLAAAMREYRVWLALAPRNVQALTRLAELLLDDSKQQEARRFIDRLGFLEPDHPELARLRSRLAKPRRATTTGSGPGKN